MVVDVYNGKYGVPGKCGSRYWTKTELYDKWEVPTIHRVSFDEIYKGNISLEYIVIRNPLSHLKSAIQTEVMEYFDDEGSVYDILNSFRNLGWGGTHFHPQFCNLIYHMWHTSNFKLEVIDLNNTTEFLKTMGFDIEYEPTEFDFKDEPNYKSKEDTWNRCVDLFPHIIDELISYTELDTKYYTALLNKDKSLINLI